MAQIEITGFEGEIPIRDALSLKESQAQDTGNVRIHGGKAFGMREPEVVQADTVTGDLLSIYQYGPTTWFEWDVEVDAHPAQVDDAFDRVIWTGEAEPRVTYNAIATGGTPYPSAWYTLGVPAPAGAPSVAITGTATDPSSVAESRFYVVTYVDVFGAEGPPSAISNEVEWRNGQSAELTSIPTAPVGNYNITNKRIYRTNTGTSGSAYQLVAELAIGTTSYTDNVLSANLGEIIPTADYDHPNASMIGLTPLPNGFFAGFFDNVLCFSEPGAPHAWPINYRLTTVSDIVGLEVLGTTLVVTTKGQPYLAAGVHPASMTLREMDVHQGCVNRRGMVSFGDVIVYPSPDGLVGVTRSGARLLTDGIIRPEDWRSEFNPAGNYTIVGSNWEGLYLFSRSTQSDGVNFVFNPRQPQIGIIRLENMAANVFGSQYNNETDTLYVSYNGNIAIWDSPNGTSLPWRWKSKDFYTDRPIMMKWGRVVADAYPITFKYFGDGNEEYSKLVADENPFRLPDFQKKFRKHTLQIGSADPDRYVVRVTCSQTIDEIRQ